MKDVEDHIVSGHRGFEISAQAFDEISKTLAERTGIRLQSGSEKLVISRLSKHIKRLGLSGFEDYIRHVQGPNGAAEFETMINSLTTNTTRFFREPGHFDILEKQMMPRLIEKAKSGGRVRLWSAACSSGEEVYSIAAVVQKCFPDAGKHNFRILATDIDSQILQQAKDGVYDANAVKDVPKDYADVLFGPSSNGTTVTVREELRNLVTVRYLNFMEPWPVSGPFDVIFCRNVAIYMDQATQMHIWTGLEQVLDPEGFLFIGHSERIGPELADRLELFGTTSFRRPKSNIALSTRKMEKIDVPSQYT